MRKLTKKKKSNNPNALRTIGLPVDVYEKLQKISKLNYRGYKDQASYLIEREYDELFKHGGTQSV